MSKRVTWAPPGRKPSVAHIERWFVWYGLPHFVQDFHKTGDFLWLFLPRPIPGLSLRVVRYAAWRVFQVTSLIAWIGRRVWHDVRHLRHMASRALPMLAVLVVLGFFSNDLWHIASDMGYLRLFFVLAGFVGLGVLFLSARLPEEIMGKLADDSGFTALKIGETWQAHMQESLTVILPGWEGRTFSAPKNLRDDQLRNMRVYLLLCQVIQVTLLSFVVWIFFLILGKVAFTNTLLADWFPNGGLQYPVRIWFVSVPFISTQLLRASALMAILASITFAVQAVTDDNYRKEFFNRTVEGLMEAARVRCVYLALLDVPETGPGPVSPASEASENADAAPAEPFVDAEQEGRPAPAARAPRGTAGTSRCRGRLWWACRERRAATTGSRPHRR